MPRRLSTSQAAKELGITKQRVGQLCVAGKLPAQRVGERGWWQVNLPAKQKQEAP